MITSSKPTHPISPDEHPQQLPSPSPHAATTNQHDQPEQQQEAQQKNHSPQPSRHQDHPKITAHDHATSTATPYDTHSHYESTHEPNPHEPTQESTSHQKQLKLPCQNYKQQTSHSTHPEQSPKTPSLKQHPSRQ